MDPNGSTNASANGNGQAPGPEAGGLDAGRVFELLVYKPMGLALGLFGQAVTKGCQTLADAPAKVQRAEVKVRQARAIGQLAVTIGARQVRRQVDSRLGGVCKAAGSLVSHLPVVGGHNGQAADQKGSPPAPEREPEPHAAARRTAARATANPATPKAPAPAEAAPPAPAAKPAVTADLPIPAYDGLSASQVVQRLGGLSATELEAVRSYEAAGRARKTVLVAIERLSR